VAGRLSAAAIGAVRIRAGEAVPGLRRSRSALRLPPPVGRREPVSRARADSNRRYVRCSNRVRDVSKEPDGDRHDGARHTTPRDDLRWTVRVGVPARVIELMHGYAGEDDAGNNRKRDHGSPESALAHHWTGSMRPMSVETGYAMTPSTRTGMSVCPSVQGHALPACGCRNGYSTYVAGNPTTSNTVSTYSFELTACVTALAAISRTHSQNKARAISPMIERAVCNTCYFAVACA
jgi:hypothetical protein